MSIRFPIETINGEKLWNLDDLMKKINIKEIKLWNTLVEKTQIERKAVLPGKLGDLCIVYGTVYRNVIKEKYTYGICDIISDNTYFPNVHFNFRKLKDPKQWASIKPGQLVCISGIIGYYDDKNVKIAGEKMECRKLCLNDVTLIKTYKRENEDL